MMFWSKTIQTNKLAVQNRSTSILISILYLIGLIRWPHNHKPKLGRPYVYSPTVILRCFIVPLWFRLDFNRALHEYLAMDLSYNRKVMKECGLSRIPNRRTFDRRLATLSRDIKNRIITMGELFCS
jgi:hypothetical protein